MIDNAAIWQQSAIEDSSSKRSCTPPCEVAGIERFFSSMSLASTTYASHTGPQTPRLTASVAAEPQSPGTVVRGRSASFEEVAEIHEYEPETPCPSPKVDSSSLQDAAAKCCEQDDELSPRHEMCSFTAAADTRKLRISATSCVGARSLGGILPAPQKSMLWQRRGAS
eukprot:TRINITY_DN11988_c0_g1_i1.p1 TRINITY_DN11988_c0_g1~~TRINITY_DN11988_c0_g1_i1.p1  ORF type:complete len:168 (+),score=30.45 TRINITY_DN11988_c0_g1_i1:38-541(+)